MLLCACGALARAGLGGGARAARPMMARPMLLGAARLLRAAPAAALLRPRVVGSALGSARWFASSSGDGPPLLEEEEKEEDEEHVVIWDHAPAVVDRRKGDVYRMGDVVQRWDGAASRTMCCACLPEKAVHAAYKDGNEVTQLCAPHARAAGTYSVDHPCRDCPEDAKVEAHYKDENGNAHQLCATHARAAGTHAVLTPCRDCPADAKLQSNYKDESGKLKQLCATHARAANTWEPARERNKAQSAPPGHRDERYLYRWVGGIGWVWVGDERVAGRAPGSE